MVLFFAQGWYPLYKLLNPETTNPKWGQIVGLYTAIYGSVNSKWKKLRQLWIAEPEKKLKENGIYAWDRVIHNCSISAARKIQK